MSLELDIDGSSVIDAVEITGTLDDSSALPSRAVDMGDRPTGVTMLLPDQFEGHRLALEVIGSDDDRPFARWSETITIQRGRDTVSVYLAVKCGDGFVATGEGCDDGNNEAGDGCSARCTLEVEPPALCGNAMLDPDEACDDANLVPDDGCSKTCLIESGWSCEGTPSVCDRPMAVCGDGVVASSETCDDANNIIGDGCDACSETSGWLCFGAPSRCVAGAVLVDRGGPSCPFGGGDGSRADPFCSLNEATKSQPSGLVVLAEGVYEGKFELDGDFDLQIVADGFVVLASAMTPTVKVKGGAQLRIEGVTVSGVGGAGGGLRLETQGSLLHLHGVVVGPSNAVGVEVKDGDLLLERSRVLDNRRGGIKLDGDGVHRVVNTILARNGTTMSDVGGVSFLESSPDSRVINVTIADNVAKPDRTAGIRCAERVEIFNTIVWNNEGGEGSGLETPCVPNYSIVSAEWTGDGVGNLFADPRFVGDDYHVDTSTNAPGTDAGDRAVAPSDDIDGDPRPMGAGIDIGADEVR